MIEVFSALGGLLLIGGIILLAHSVPMRFWPARVEDFLLGPLRPEFDDLVLLAAGAESPQRLKEMLDWRMQRGTMVVKGMIGGSIGLLTPLVLAGFKDELKIPLGVMIAAVIGALLVALPGLYVLYRLSRLSSGYAALLSELDQLR